MLTKLSCVAACQRRGVEAVHCSLRALDSEPQCPFALWNHAGALHVVGESAKARRIYRRLIAKGLVKLQRGRCGCGGLLFARGLLADCHAQPARHAMKIGSRAQALREVLLALAVRKPGGQRVNPLPELRRMRRAIEQMI